MSEKKIALVTGASRGIGLEIAKELIKSGISVIGTSRDKQLIEEIAASETTDGATLYPMQLDISDPIILEKNLSILGDLLPFPNILINNAGRVIYAEVHELTDEIWNMHFDLNVGAAMRLCRRAIPELKKRPVGRIVNIGSAVTLRSSPGLAGYTSSKHALEGLTRVLSQELVPNITANCIHPGTILSGMTIPLMEEDPALKEHYESFSPMGRLALPEDISHAALFLSLDASSFINGIGLNVDGGYVAYG